MKIYKLFSISVAFIFAVVGFIFLFFPNSALTFFNSTSGYLGFTKSPVEGTNFYLILASAYMYVVTLLAFLMYGHPEQKVYPFLLSQAKLASAVVSLYLFLVHEQYLIYLTNFLVDGFIGIIVLFLMKMQKKAV